jgi:hypothetical protein
LDALLGEVDVADGARDRRDGAAGLAPEDVLDGVRRGGR